MLKVTLDTNVLISALITNGKSRALFYDLVKGKATLVVSGGILEEFVRVTNDPRIRRYVTEKDVKGFLQIISSVAQVIKVKSTFRVIKEDPDDDIILETAFDGNVDNIVTGDEHLLKLKKFKGIKMITVDDMVKLIE
jgi:putative PIN family toxin of toxin-antitoxin system